MERKRAESRGKHEDSFFEKNKDINKEELTLDELFTENITNECNQGDGADDPSSHVGKEENENVRKRQIGRKVKKVNSTNKFKEVRLYIFLVLLICLYSLLVVRPEFFVSREN
ncbi:hypothetical protein AK88_01153 [Plasmodium fragile]|uniref:Uncharacterized protein n=1 Tax=Plasmodium fragile TaxID=5857 RepID=A0A0D9QQS1_PLAFR|nr:uncharacterized protein AK88_01153 [Plasmodium fragile]KJP89273.1 hypothetical protein AK88_01153 [Plasmodium fragile]